MKKLITLLCLIPVLASAQWTPPATAGGGTPAGSSGDIQTNGGSGAFSSINTSSGLKASITDENAPDGASSKVLFALGSVSIASGKTATFSNSLIFTGTDSSTLNIGAGGTLGTSAYITLGTGVGASLAIANNSAGGYAPIDGSATETNKTFNSSTNSISDANTYTHDLTAAPNQTGGWNYYNVITSDFTTATTSIGTDVTGLVTGTLTNSAKYIFEANLEITHDTDAAGVKIVIHGAGTGSAATVWSVATVNGGAVATGASIAINQVDTATVAILNYASPHGTVVISGSFYATSTGTATMSIQILNTTAGNAVVKKGSVLRIRKATI